MEAKPLPAGFQGTPPVHGRRNPSRLGGSSGLQWRSGVWKAGGMLYVDSDSPVYIQHNPGSPLKIFFKDLQCKITRELIPLAVYLAEEASNPKVWQERYGLAAWFMHVRGRFGFLVLLLAAE